MKEFTPFDKIEFMGDDSVTFKKDLSEGVNGLIYSFVVECHSLSKLTTDY